MTWQVFRSLPGGRRAGCIAVVAGGAMLLAAAGVSSASVSSTGSSLASSGAAAATAFAGDGPAGFWYGTDSRTITISGSAPYHEPVIGGYYGGYIGMIGNWARREGCGGI